MAKLVFATANRHKVQEVQQIMGNQYDFLSLEDIGCLEDIEETETTIEGNALLKARYVYDKYGYNCFAEDTGLQINALGGAPGVYTARYAGEQKSSEDNINKVLQELENATDRTAYFKTVIALVINGENYLFEGIAKGLILKEKQGEGGFGYDAIFLPDEATKTFAELTALEKDKISHRGQATTKFKEFLLR